MQTRLIGQTPVSAIGLGGMPLSIEGRPDHERAIATIHAALDAGITLIDSADSYHLTATDVGHNEALVAEGLRSWGGDASTVLVATKGGHLRPGDGSWTQDGSPRHLRKAVEDSLQRLGVEAIDLYQFHRPDPRVPYADSVGVLVELLDAGKIRMAGISNANPAQIREAREILGDQLVSVQNQYSPAFRSSQPELDLCAELGLAFLAWSPLGGISNAAALGASHGVFAEVAAAHRVSPQQVALAWELAQASVVIPIPGSSRPQTIRDSVRAVDLLLAPEEITALDAARA
ncbi:MAG: aldo/keto reductase [Cellulomonas sp.]